MKPQYKKIGWHLLGWSLFIGYALSGYFIYQWDYKVLLITLSQLFLYMVQFYVCYLLLFPLWMRYRHWLVLTVGIIGVMVLYICLRYLVEEVLFDLFFGFSNYSDDTSFSYFFFDNIYWALPGIFMGAVVWAFESTLQKERENRSLRQEKTQAELAFLKTQVNPHFLYNTLNYIYSLAYPVSDKLGNAIIKLSDLMRYMLHESQDGKIELQKEIDYLQNYIDIYRLRFDEKFYVNFEIQGHVNGQRVPSLVLIPFVENALKHGVVDDPASPVTICLNVQDQQLYFEVSNRINHHQKDQTTGVGLPNIRRRLDLLYPNQYSLQIEEDAYQYTTKMKLQQI